MKAFLGLQLKSVLKPLDETYSNMRTGFTVHFRATFQYILKLLFLQFIVLAKVNLVESNLRSRCTAACHSILEYCRRLFIGRVLKYFEMHFTHKL